MAQQQYFRPYVNDFNHLVEDDSGSNDNVFVPKRKAVSLLQCPKTLDRVQDVDLLSYS